MTTESPLEIACKLLQQWADQNEWCHETKPLGAPNSPAREEQNRQKVLYRRTVEFLTGKMPQLKGTD
jgi:hypothetical protein